MHNNRLYIGMAGHHQIWALDLQRRVIWPYAGDGDENLKDGPLPTAKFAQPSGLGTDGSNLYVADSEASGIRSVPMTGAGPVQTVVGVPGGLFEYGDVNGQGKEVRLQHALDVTFYNGKLYVADTYNNKIKLIDPATQTCQTLVGDTAGTFSEPGGVSALAGKLYVADSSNHRIRVVDLDTREVTTLELQGVESVHRPTGTSSKKASSGR